MRIGYPCINRTIDCTANNTFRLKSYSEIRLIDSLNKNLECLRKILQFNVENGLLFFRISSDLVPFASHPRNSFNWQKRFQEEFKGIGEHIIKNRIRISMHPDQFTLINSLTEEIFQRSKNELEYHAEILDLMNLDTTAKIQIHVGGVYGDKEKSIERFIERFNKLDKFVTRRLVIENDDRLYNVNDCLKINSETHIPILFDAFHHKLNNSTTQTTQEYFKLATRTWNEKNDGAPMVDYSSQKPDGPPRQHAETIDLADFGFFLRQTEPFDYDVMLEIKDKEKSALKALDFAMGDLRVKNFNKLASIKLF